MNLKHIWITGLNVLKQLILFHPNQKVIILSEPELDRKVNGIPLVDAVAKDLNELAEKLGFKYLAGFKMMLMD